jgi:hypothetical protein
MERLSHYSKFLVTDYSSFESHFKKDLMEDCEFLLYEHMLSSTAEGAYAMNLIRTVIGGKNHVKVLNGHYAVDATRMSGEMNTSLGNGFSNLMFMLFTLQELGITDFDGVVEGDDALFGIHGQPPTTQDFKKLGLSIKLEVHESIRTTSFCGQVFDDIDKALLTDPLKVLATFGWTGKQYLNASRKKLLGLVKAKSLSYLYQHPACPIVTELALYGLRITQGIKYVTTDYEDSCFWKSYKLQHMKTMYHLIASGYRKKKIGMGSRFLVEEKFGITVQQQLIVEEYLRSLNTVQELSHPVFDDLPFHPHTAHNYEYYVGYYRKNLPVNIRMGNNYINSDFIESLKQVSEMVAHGEPLHQVASYIAKDTDLVGIFAPISKDL